MRVASFVGLLVLTAGCGLGYSIEAQKETQQQNEPTPTPSSATTEPTSTTTSAEPPPPPTATSTPGTPTATLSMNGSACLVSAYHADANQPPCGNTWDVFVDAECPDEVSVLITSISGRPYPQACASESIVCSDPSTGTTSMTVSFGGGKVSSQISSTDCAIASGPTAEDPSILVNASGTALGQTFVLSVSN